MRHLALTSLLACQLSLAAAQSTLPTEAAPARDLPAIQAAEAAGLRIYRHDAAAAAASDVVQAKGSPAVLTGTRGWITQEAQAGIIVTFIDAAPRALYRVTVAADGTVSQTQELPAPLPLTAFERGALAARNAAVQASFRRCAERYNTVVFPAEAGSDAKWTVYLLPATTDKRHVPVGGTHRLEIDGDKVVRQREFTRSCIALERAPQAVALVISHLLDPTPTEAHVFWALWANKPLVVTTGPNRNWVVQDGKVGLIPGAPATP